MTPGNPGPSLAESIFGVLCLTVAMLFAGWCWMQPDFPAAPRYSVTP